MTTIGRPPPLSLMSPATFQPFSMPTYMCGAHRVTMSPMPASNAAIAWGWSMFLMMTSLSLNPNVFSQVLKAKWAEETVVVRMVFPFTVSGLP